MDRLTAFRAASYYIPSPPSTRHDRMPRRQAAMGAAMATDTSDLGEMSDPALITHWAAVRSELALTPRDSPRHGEIKRAYDLVLAEYRRRIASEPAP